MKGPQIEGLEKDALKKSYVDDPDASMASVAKKLGVHRETVRRWVTAHGLPAKSRGRKDRPKKNETQKLADKEWLKKQLEQKSVKQIARDLETTDHNVWYWSRKYGLRDENISKSDAVKAGLKKQYPDGRSGKNSSNWQGGRVKRQGYIVIHRPDHPRSPSNGYVMEHRLIMEDHLGRYLEPNEVVHHLNGIKDDNRIENLEVVNRGDYVSNHFQASHEVLQMREEIERLKAENKQLQAENTQLRHDIQRAIKYGVHVLTNLNV